MVVAELLLMPIVLLIYCVLAIIGLAILVGTFILFPPLGILVLIICIAMAISYSRGG